MPNLQLSTESSQHQAASGLELRDDVGLTAITLYHHP